MKIPEKIKGRNRVRDGAIVVCFKRKNMDFPEIAEKFGLTERRIQQILSTNHAFVKRDKEWEREKRINILNRLIEKKKESTTKDIAELLEFQRKEIDGDEENRKSSNETKVIIIRDTIQKEANGNTDRERQISGSVSVLRV